MSYTPIASALLTVAAKRESSVTSQEKKTSFFFLDKVKDSAIRHVHVTAEHWLSGETSSRNKVHDGNGSLRGSSAWKKLQHETDQKQSFFYKETEMSTDGSVFDEIKFTDLKLLHRSILFPCVFVRSLTMILIDS